MNAAQFLTLITFTNDKTLVMAVLSPEAQWLLSNGFIEVRGSGSYGISAVGLTFVLGQLDKLLRLGL